MKSTLSKFLLAAILPFAVNADAKPNALFTDGMVIQREIQAPVWGTADAGEKIENQIDTTTKLPIISLYGKNRKPTNEQLEGIDIMVFDLQDVGVRFYTYLSTLHYVMEACAENNIPLIVLDRPNPNAHYVDGPVLEKENTSFVGMHSVPIVYGMTIGEYAQMINGEKWLTNEINCDFCKIIYFTLFLALELSHPQL